MENLRIPTSQDAKVLHIKQTHTSDRSQIHLSSTTTLNTMLLVAVWRRTIVNKETEGFHGSPEEVSLYWQLQPNPLDQSELSTQALV